MTTPLREPPFATTINSILSTTSTIETEPAFLTLTTATTSASEATALTSAAATTTTTLSATATTTSTRTRLFEYFPMPNSD